MAYRVLDLIITALGCGSSHKPQPPPPPPPPPPKPCGSSTQFELACGDSTELLTQPPFVEIDPRYQRELRQLLLYALATSNVAVGQPMALEGIEEQMTPRTLKDVERLERQLTGALVHLRGLKRELKGAARKPRPRRAAASSRKGRKP